MSGKYIRNKSIAVPGDIYLNPASAYLARLNTDVSRQNTAKDLLRGLRTINSIRIDIQSKPQESTRTLKQEDVFLFSWHLLRYEHLAAVKAALIKDYPPRTVNRTLTVLRQVLYEAWHLDLIDTESYYRAIEVSNLSYHSDLAGRALNDSEIVALLEVCGERGRIGIRDAAIIALLLTCGLRNAELCSLNVSDYNPDNGTLLVNGKGLKQRKSYVMNETAEYLSEWLYIRGNLNGPLFMALSLAGNIIPGPKRLASSGLYKMLQRRGAAAGVKHFSPHDFRRTFVTNLLKAGVDPLIVARQAGHESVATTMVYDRRTEQTKREAVQCLDLPHLGC